MHILFLSDNFPPESNAPANRTFEHARHWVRAGHQVTVITCAPNFPFGRVFCGYRNRLSQTEEMSGITIIRVWSFMAKNEGFFLRFLDFMSFMISGFLRGLRVKDLDVVVGTSPQFFTVCAAYLLARAKRRPFVFEMRDIWPESLHAVGLNNAGLYVRLISPLADYLYQKADHIVVVTHSFKTYLTNRNITASRITVIPNGADTKMFRPVSADESLQTQLQLAGKFVVGYIGTHGLAHCLETLVEAARLASTSDDLQSVQFLSVGTGAQFEVIKKQAAGLNNFTMTGQVKRADISRYWSVLDAGIIHLKDAPLFEHVIPSKIFEAMAMGIPLLHGVRGESAEIVHSTGIGVFFEPEKPEALLSAIRQMMLDRTAYVEMKTSCISAAQTYNRAVLAYRMADCLQGIKKRHE